MVPEAGEVWEYKVMSKTTSYIGTYYYLVLKLDEGSDRPYTLLRLSDGAIVNAIMENVNVHLKTEWSKIA